MKKLSKYFLVLIFLLPCVILWGCGAQVQTINFSETSKTISVDEIYELNTSIVPEIENVVITYSVADTTIAQILPNARVLGVKEGQTKIYATAENGVIAEMTLNVVLEKTQLSTPTGFIFDGNQRILRWINVLNAYSYEVTITNGEENETFETFSNNFSFDDFDLVYEEYTEYEFSVMAKPSPTSKIYLSSSTSETYTFKQVVSVNELRYETENIIFEYDVSLIDLDETGELLFNLTIINNNVEVANEDFSLDDLTDNEISFNFIPLQAGQYTVKVYVEAEEIEKSITKEIQLVKLVAPIISSNGLLIQVSGGLGESLKYFKTIDDDRQEITTSGLVIGELPSGQEVLYEAYSYRQNTTGIFYIDSDISSFIVKKLETPENVKIEKIDNNSIKISWDTDYEISNYEIYVNDEIIQANSISTINQTYYATYADIFDESGIYTIYLKTKKTNDENYFYLKSNKSAEMTIIRFSAPEIEYDQLSNRFILTSPNYNMGANFNFNVVYGEENFNLTNEVIAENEELYNLSGLNINLAGICETTSRVSRESITDTTVYLDSEVTLFNVNKLETPELSYLYENNLLRVLWDKIEDAGYLVQIKNITTNSEVTLSGSSITEAGNTVSIEINNLENGNQYEIYVQAISLINFGIQNEVPTQFLSSAKATLSLNKLSEPIITITGKDIGSITFDWDDINNATAYDVYVDGIKIETIAGTNYTIDNIGEGSHTFSVVAISSADNIIPSSIGSRSTINFYFINEINGITYEKINDTQSEITFDQVDFIDGYELEIIDTDLVSHIFTSYGLRGNDVVFTLTTLNIFNKAGLYTIKARTISDEQNVILNNDVELNLTMFAAVSSIGSNEENTYIEWVYNSGISIEGYDLFINNILVTDYDYDIDGTRYYIGDFEPGMYSVKIIVKGNNTSTIDSLPFTAQIMKREVIEQPDIVSFGAEDTSFDSQIELVFNEVDNADYYIVYLVGEETKEINVTPSGSGQITQLIDRSFFEADEIQYLYVRAIVDNSSLFYLSSAIPSFDNTDCVVRIYKYITVDSIPLNLAETQLDLTQKQAYINSVYYTNSYTIPNLASEEVINFNVRQTGVSIDSFVSGTFYMASDWIDFQFIKLETPTVNIDEVNGNINCSSDDSSNIQAYVYKIEFYGLGESIIDIEILNRSVANTLLTYEEIKTLILQGKTSDLINYVGDYKILIKANAVSQYNRRIYLDSHDSSNETDFIINGNLTSSLINGEVSAEGVLELSLLKIDSYFITGIDLNINQLEDSASLRLLLDGTYTNLSNTLNPFDVDFYEIVDNGDVLTLYVDFKSVVSGGNISIDWTAIGDSTYSITAPSAIILNSSKLTTPILSYSNDELGNYIHIDLDILETYDENVVIYASYNGEILTFTDGSLLLPYSWEDVSNIIVYALKEMTNVIGSDIVNVTMTLYDNVANVRLENDDIEDKTYLRWNNISAESSWLVHINFDSELLSTELVYTKELELTDINLPYSGSYTFEVVAYGNNTNIFNSNLTEFVGRKLGTGISISNANGVLNWSLSSIEEIDISYFRICLLGNTKISFENNIYSDSLSDYTGLIPIQFKLVGDVSRNIISSNYTNIVNFYRYATPTTFRINGGQFVFGTETDENVTDDLFRIKIGENTYSYITQTGVSSINDFYTTTTTEGTAIAFIKGGNSKYIGATQVLTLNSNETSIEFSRLEISYDNEEKYLIQTRIDGVITTDFNWNWTESGEVTTRTAIVYIFSYNLVLGLEVDGWTRVANASGLLDYYYQLVNTSATYEGDSTKLSVSVTLPQGLESSYYALFIRKSDSSLEGNQLSSKLDRAFNFIKLGTPTLEVQDGKLSWTDISNASTYNIRYTGDRIGYIELGTSNNYELGSSFADVSTSRNYDFRIVAVGNVPYSKPAEMPTIAYTYTVAGQTSLTLDDVVKPKVSGEIVLDQGSLKWKSGQTYFTYANILSGSLEFVIYDSLENEIARAPIPSIVFSSGFPSFTEILSNHFGFAQEAFSTTGIYTIKYRELGFSSFANSEYRDLKNNIVVPGDTNASYEFKLTPTISRIEITEEGGLDWSSIIQGDLASIKYDIFFALNDDNYIYATTINAPTHSISLDDIKELVAYQENKLTISGIFIVVRGDSTNYISGFSSPTIFVKAIDGEVQLSTENGFIQWNEVEGSNKYQIMTVIDYDTVIYEIYQDGIAFKMNKYVEEILVLEDIELESVAIEDGMWKWDFAQDENIESGILYNLYIRYIPEADLDVFAIPGEFTEVALSVYKLGTPNVSIMDGDLTWEEVTNAGGYKIWIRYLGSSDEILETKTAIIEKPTEASLIRYSLNLENYEQSRIMIAVQAIGPTETVGGYSYINTFINYIDVNYIENTLSDVERDGDILSWNDSETNSYIVDIYNNDVLIWSYATDNTSVDLASLELDNLLSYKALVKIKGTTGTLSTGYLSSISTDNSILFNVLTSVDEINVLSGEIYWDKYETDVEYKVIIESTSGNNYAYIIGLVGDVYEVKSLTKNGGLISFKSYVSEDSIEGQDIIKFWTAEVEENYSMFISVVVVGMENEGVYYISSNKAELSSSVTKSMSTQLSPTFVANGNIMTFSWLNYASDDYRIEIVDGNGHVIVSSTVENNSYIYDISALASGTYTFRVQRYNINPSAMYLISNFAIVEFIK